MQVSSISNFSSFGNKDGNFNVFMTMDDDAIRQYAVHSAIQKNQKTHKKVNRLYYSVPLVAAASAALLTKGKVPFLTKEVSGKAAKVAGAVSSGAHWAFLLGTVAAGAGLNNKLEARSEKYRNFREEHPVLSVLGDLTAFLAVTFAVPKALRAGFSKLSPKALDRVKNAVAKSEQKINGLKVPNFAKKIGEKVSKLVPQRVKDWKANRVMPEGLKNIAKGIVAWAPEITLLSSLVTAVDSRAKFLRDVNSTYSKLKETQQNLIKEKIAAMDAE